MINKRRSISFYIGLAVMVITFALLYIGVVFLLANNINGTNLFAYVILSVIIGGVAGLFYYYKLMIAFWLVLLGTAIGYVQLYTIFIDGMGGWADLTGIISLLLWIIIGFITGVVIQFISYLFKKYKKE